MKSVRGIPCWHVLIFQLNSAKYATPTPRRKGTESRRHLSKRGTGKWGKARKGRGGSELRLNEKYFPFTHNIRTGAALDIWTLAREASIESQNADDSSEVAPPFLFSLACLCLLWVAFQTTRLPLSQSYFPKKEIKHFHSSCFCFAPIKVDRKKIIEMIQTCVCMCVSHPHKLSTNC